MAFVFVTGGTGYMGRNARLHKRGHRVRCVVRPGSENKLPLGHELCIGDALRSETYLDHLQGARYSSPSHWRTEAKPQKLAWVVQTARGVRIMEVPQIRTGRAYEDLTFVVKAS